MKFFGFQKENIRLKGGGNLEKKHKELQEEVRYAIEYFEYISDNQELEMSQEDINAISLFTQLIEKEIIRLGMKKISFCDNGDYQDIVKQIHFVHPEKKNDIGGFFPESRSIEVSGREKNIMKKYSSLLHEMLHLFSFSRVIIEDNGGQKIRVGYSTDKQLNFFNEGVTEQLTLDILKDNEREISQLLNINHEEIKKFFHTTKIYVHHRNMIKSILENVSRHENISYPLLREKLLKGYFNGNMMFLRSFEKTYGDGFIKFISQPSKYGINFIELEKIISSPENFKKFMKRFHAQKK